jgi:hypothetical protein
MKRDLKFLFYIVLLFILVLYVSIAHAASLSTNYIPKASSGTVIVDSQMFDNGTNIGIGSTSPNAKLDIDGTTYTGRVHIDGAVYIGVASVDPCPGLAPGYLFFKPSGQPCFCNYAGVDVSIYDGTTACF